MRSQDQKHHSRYVIAWHFVAPILLLAIIIGSIIHLFRSATEDTYAACLLVLIALVLPVIWWHERRFALRAQDRAIRAEENFRHFILTGQPLDSRLRLRQIIALRFASDAEMPALAKKAVEEKLRPAQIKSAIRQWRPDYYRV